MLPIIIIIKVDIIQKWASIQGNTQIINVHAQSTLIIANKDIESTINYL